MQSKLHPLTKTAQDLRRTITRLEAYEQSFPNDPDVASGAVSKMIEDLKEVRRQIPKTFVDADLQSQR